jgi:hypothetical protein
MSSRALAPGDKELSVRKEERHQKSGMLLVLLVGGKTIRVISERRCNGGNVPRPDIGAAALL